MCTKINETVNECGGVKERRHCEEGLQPGKVFSGKMDETCLRFLKRQTLGGRKGREETRIREGKGRETKGLAWIMVRSIVIGNERKILLSFLFFLSFSSVSVVLSLELLDPVCY